MLVIVKNSHGVAIRDNIPVPRKKQSIRIKGMIIYYIIIKKDIKSKSEK